VRSNVGFLVALGIFVFNAFDALATYTGIEFGQVREINPVMIFLMDAIGNWCFLVKVVLGGVLFYLVYENWKDLSRPIKAITWGVFGLYSFLAIYHSILLIFYYKL
jgi:hypothetical protein